MAINPEDAKEWSQSLGQSTSGNWRQIALAKRMGVPKALGLTDKQWVNDYLGGYIRMYVEDRREAVAELAAEGYSTRQIADVLGVDQKTAWNDMHAEEISSNTSNSPDEQAAATEENSSQPIDALAALAASEEARELEAQRQRTEERRAERIETMAEAGRGNTPLTALGRRFALIYADPPWQYEFSETDRRRIENQYPTLSLADIKALPVRDVAFDDCVLFLWTTSPKLFEALFVINAWGFDYRSGAVWDKQAMGMGYYFRQQHEHLLVATRGNPPPPRPEDRVRSVLRFPRGEHSAKPPELYELIERMYPELDKLEMFARGSREGWTAWGNQAEKAAP